ncbi:MAG: glycosyl transferase, partial [Acidobacteriaceae bacterium]|nr:glycosyl transferase [Acidobacteriaceae bacterium]
ILHPLVNRFLQPYALPRMDFSKEIPDDCRTFVVIPTLILSRAGVENLLERIEIHYLANRDRNLLFGLLTDFPDAPRQHVAKDDLLDACAEGIRNLNKRYGRANAGPFYLFHRERLWNPSETVWMGRERKRGKLDDFNEFLLGRSDHFAEKVGALDQIRGIRWVITLDTDTQLPRDAARELIATMAHPLNRPVLDKSGIVRRGYALLQPRVSVSMESARRSRLANLYSGQTGLDPYTKAVSDVYQDLFGQASYTGKGIYDLRAFVEATQGRFPDNTLLSHDLIEGEHVRVGLVTDVEVVDDFPASYESYSKRKHRWVRGDWQISAWLLPRVPDANWKWYRNPLSILSRWKILDNLRRSVFELTLFLFFVTGLWTPDALVRATIMIVILLMPAFAQTFFSLLRIPPRRFWRSFLRETATQLLRGFLDGSVQLAFLLHQALLMSDAILRTLYRRLVSNRKLLEWESAAQAELGGSKGLSLVTIYLFACPAVATAVATLASRSEQGLDLLPLLILAGWAASPLSAEFVSHRVRFRRTQEQSDLQFLRDISLRTWRYFVDFSTPEDHALVPDNVQQDPWIVAHRSSPTNMGLQLVADVAAYDFGYLTAPELSKRLEAVLETLQKLETMRGHFYNWYDTRTLEPLPPRYVSSVDSGNLAAALVTVKQTCLDVMEAPLISGSLLKGTKDHCELVRHSLPEGARTAPIMKQLQSFCSEMSGKPEGLFHWDGLLTELAAGSSKFLPGIEWLCDHWKLRERGSLEDALYWTRALHNRVVQALDTLHQLAPWLSGPLGKQLRVLGSEPRVSKLMTELNRIPTFGGLEQQYDTLEKMCRDLLDSEWMPGAHRQALRNLIDVVTANREQSKQLIDGFERIAAVAHRMFHEMEFSFLLEHDRKLMSIGYDVERQRLDHSHYDLLASEARTGVFLAVAKGDFPREAWFRLGRKLTSYGGHRTLLSWSGTMFEYLMPALFMRTYEDSLLAEGLSGAVRIQQLYCQTRRVPWGISEAAHAERDASRVYQYRAFGVPVIGLKRQDARDLVIAPYATMMAAGIDPHRATANLKDMAARGWLGDYGFYESVDYSAGHPEVVKAFMVHHQGMGFVALANALLDNPIQRRFHADPLVLATELLLQERLPVLVDET